MSRGRCSACGFTDASCKKVQAHIMSCPDAISLMKTNPAALLDPEKEYQRWDMEENTPELREERKAAKYAGFRAEADRKMKVSQRRWETKDE